MENSTKPSPIREEQLTVLIKFVEFTNIFRAIERCIWFREIQGRERNGEHSFQIAFVAWFINDLLKLGLDVSSIIQYALVHDVVEIYAGDTSAFRDPLMSKKAWLVQKKTKEMREAAALKRIEKEWGDVFPTMIESIHAYEMQINEESQLVYATDKLVSTINVFLDDGRTWKDLQTTLQEMDAYKGPRSRKHPDVGKLYDALLLLLKQDKSLFCKKQTG